MSMYLYMAYPGTPSQCTPMGVSQYTPFNQSMPTYKYTNYIQYMKDNNGHKVYAFDRHNLPKLRQQFCSSVD